MSKCIRCSEKITGFWGFFKDRHKECEKKFVIGQEEITALVTLSVSTNADLQNLKDKVLAISSENRISPEVMNVSVVKGWELALGKALEDNVLSIDEEQRLMSLASTFSLTQEQLNSTGAYTRAAMNGVLRDIFEGKMPARVKVDGAIPFNFQKEESLIWLFNGVQYFEEKIKRSYEGGYSGVSVRIAKGIYYRTGGFKGHPVETAYMAHLGNGILAITNKHFYFAGPNKSFRVPFSKIVSFVPYSDGIGITRDTTTAKPQVFKTGEGWFIYNLVKHLAGLAS